MTSFGEGRKPMCFKIDQVSQKRRIVISNEHLSFLASLEMTVPLSY